MSCKIYGWRGHRFINGVCSCKYTKNQLQTKRLREEILAKNSEPIDIGIFIKGFFFIGFLIIAYFFIYPIFLTIVEETQTTSSNYNDLTGENTTVPSGSSGFPTWVFFPIVVVMGVYFVFKFARFGGGEY